jgi:hypothetical protein
LADWQAEASRRSEVSTYLWSIVDTVTANLADMHVAGYRSHIEVSTTS